MRWLVSLAVAATLVLGPSVDARTAAVTDDVASLRAVAKAKKKARVIARLKKAAGAAPAPGASGEVLRGRMGGVGVARFRRLGDLPLVALDVDAQQLEALLASGMVERVREDRLLRPTLAESTARIRASVAQAQGSRGQGQVVAVLDTGIDGAHPFLRGKVLREACFSSDDPAAGVRSLCRGGAPAQVGPGTAPPCPSLVAGCDHGTHVAGIAAGRGTGVSGVAPDAGIVAVEVFSRVDDPGRCGPSASCPLAYESDIIDGLNHVLSLTATYRIAAVNLSLGGGRFASACDEEPIKEAIDALRARGVATVVAAGNEGDGFGVSYPGCVSTAVTVASSTDAGAEGISAFSNNSPLVDLVAPGEVIVSSLPGGRFGGMAGTSMAAPHVAGAFAALKAANPRLTVGGIEQALKATGRPVQDSRSGLGRPRIDVAAALAALRQAGAGASTAPAF